MDIFYSPDFGLNHLILLLILMTLNRKHDKQSLMPYRVRTMSKLAPFCFTCIGVCMVAMGWSMEVKAEIADMRTSSLTSTLPWTSVCVIGEGGTVM